MRKIDLYKKIITTNQIEWHIFQLKRYRSSCPYEYTREKATRQVDVFNSFFTIVPRLITHHVEYDLGVTLSSSKRLEVTSKVLKDL